MTIPDFQSLMLPILEFMGDGKEHPLNEIIEHIYGTSNLAEEEKKQLLPSGREPILRNRIRWARFYLEKAGLLESTRRAFSRISERGLNVLTKKPEGIDAKFLESFPEFVKFKAPKREEEITEPHKLVHYTPVSMESINPTELLEDVYRRLRSTSASELLSEVKKATPRFFENLVVELLVKMGYGGSREDAGKAIGQSGDEGIDGIIKEDKLGLETVYLQAKRWEGTVGRPEIHKFVGALKGQGANKGIFITTSSFTREAADYAAKIDSPRIVLIDGEKLAELMYEYDIGVSKEATYEVKKIDSDFFSEE
jgi:restriction system protein